jgi:hypothetical protein
LSKDKNPKKADMQAISGHLYQLEDSADLQSDAIRATKIHRALTEILKLEIIPGGSEFQFRSRFEHLLERCNKALKCEKLLADNTEQPIEPPENSADEDGHSTAETKVSTPHTRTGKVYFQDLPAVLTFLVSNVPSSSLKVADNSQPCKRKRQIIDHMTIKNKRLRNTRKLELFLI